MSNPLLGRYFHDAMLDLTITDALFNMQYLALNAGGQVTVGGNSIVNEQVTTTKDNEITVAGTPVDFGGIGTVGWYSLPALRFFLPDYSFRPDRPVCLHAEGLAQPQHFRL